MPNKRSPLEMARAATSDARGAADLLRGATEDLTPRLSKLYTGVVVDGGTRDVEFLIEMGFAVYARYATPRDIVGYWMVDAMDVPIKIGKVAIAPHDYLLADRDGIIVLPRAKASEIVSAAGVAVGTESQIRTAILGGMDPQEAYLKYGKF